MRQTLEKRCYEFGKEYFGPFLLAYTNWLIDKIEKENIKKVFFFSRDGYMMQESFKLLNLDDDEVEVNYAYFSRKSIRQALLYKTNDYKDSLKYLTKERYVSLGKILDYYGLNDEAQNEIFDFYKKDKDFIFTYEDLKDCNFIEEIYYKYLEQINKNSKEQAELLKKYIFQIDMIGKCAIVDIGWHGSMQYFLDQFFINENIDSYLIGLYVGISPKYSFNGSSYGFLFESNDLSLYKSIMCFHGGYEKLFQSLEGSTVGYRLDDGIIYPIKKDYEFNETFSNRIRNWQNGALDFICEKKRGKSGSTKKLIKFGKNPPLWGVKLFSGFFLDDGQEQLFVSDKPFYKYRSKELKQKLGGSVWKTGFLKSIFKIPAPYFFVYRVMKK